MKYIMSGGLAFSEQKDMEKLRRYANEGWHVKRFAFLGYVLEQGAPADVIYSVDYRKLDGDAEDYYALCDMAGWSHVASHADTHLFVASPGTTPLYSDRETTVDKYENLAKPLHVATIPLTALAALSWIGVALTITSVQRFFFIIAAILTVLALPLLFTTLVAYRQKWRVQEKAGYVTLSKLAPIAALAIALAALVLTDSNVVMTIAAAVAGGVLFPALLKVMLSLYYQTKKA